jgi:hypothetical protein
MVIRIGSFCYLLVIIITVVILIGMLTDVYAQEPGASLDWSIKASQNTYYPGEPVLLTLTIKNAGQQEEKIDSTRLWLKGAKSKDLAFQPEVPLNCSRAK